MNFMFNLENYETVDERLEKFWEKYPDGRIATELVSAQEGRYIVQAFIYKTYADPVAFATGLAEETISTRGVNSTSACENAESSAIGRALHTGGISKHSEGKPRPSREEMVKVTRTKLAEPTKEYIPVMKEDDPWTIKTVAMPITSEQAVQTVKEIIGGTTDKDIPNCLCGKQRILRTGTSKQGKQWAAWDCPFKAGVYQVGQQKACEPDRVWLELNSLGQWQPQKARA
jgi:hypothetical protein